MSKLARQAVIKNIQQIREQLDGIGSSTNDEVKTLTARLTKETDPFIQTALQERLKRLEANQRQSRYQEYKDDLETLHQQLNAALETMNKLPFYLDGLRTGEPDVKKPAKKAAKKKGR